MRFQSKRSVLLACVSASLLLLLMNACTVPSNGQYNPPQSNGSSNPPQDNGSSNPPQPDSVDVQGVGSYQSQIFTLQGGSYDVRWLVQQTPMGVNVPCSVDADLWNEAGYWQRNLITETSGPPDAGQVTVRMPQGNWYLEINNSCSDSQPVIRIDLVGP